MKTPMLANPCLRPLLLVVDAGTTSTRAADFAAAVHFDAGLYADALTAFTDVAVAWPDSSRVPEAANDAARAALAELTTRFPTSIHVGRLTTYLPGQGC
jgi:hypothetical protein